MNSVDEHNYQWFKKNLPDLINEYGGKYLIIHEESMRGVYPTFNDALDAALKIAKPGEFLVQHCVTEEESIFVVQYSHPVCCLRNSIALFKNSFSGTSLYKFLCHSV